ncbi:MAG TPA: hypothetical protein EYP89_01815 [Candidatus Omnitrophica bacterium]|nr:hypothetical protein [Candidatus Omnitrophota bacterium]
MYLSFIFFGKRKRTLLTTLLLIALIIFPFLLPHKVKERIGYTFTPAGRYKPIYIYGKPITLEESTYARIGTWIWVLSRWKKILF